MFQISGVKTRYFEFEAPDNLKVLHIEPPKLKTLNRLSKLRSDASPEEMTGIIATIISKNRENRKVDSKLVMEWMTSDQLAAFIKAFLGWLNDTKENDPN